MRHDTLSDARRAFSDRQARERKEKFGLRARKVLRDRLRHEPNLFDPADDEAEARANVRANEDVRSGRLIDHGAVRAWLES